MTTISYPYTNDCFVFDIDGTLADHHDHRSPFDETKVFMDKPIIPVFKVLESLYTSGYKIIFLSGRTNACREATVKWLMKQLPVLSASDIDLYMRGINDFRGDAIIKKEIYDAVILPKYKVIGVFDDRLRVCKMLYENGIFCFNVNQGLKDF